jgi:hypothetical protein
MGGCCGLGLSMICDKHGKIIVQLDGGWHVCESAHEPHIMTLTSICDNANGQEFFATAQTWGEIVSSYLKCSLCETIHGLLSLLSSSPAP